MLDGVYFANVSLVDEDINPVYNILTYEFNKENKVVTHE